jgi:hypothetical protein
VALVALAATLAIPVRQVTLATPETTVLAVMVALVAVAVMAAVAVLFGIAARLVALGVTPVVAPGAAAIVPLVPHHPAVSAGPPEEVPVVLAVLRFIVSALTISIPAAVVAGVAAQV